MDVHTGRSTYSSFLLFVSDEFPTLVALGITSLVTPRYPNELAPTAFNSGRFTLIIVGQFVKQFVPNDVHNGKIKTCYFWGSECIVAYRCHIRSIDACYICDIVKAYVPIVVAFGASTEVIFVCYRRSMAIVSVVKCRSPATKPDAMSFEYIHKPPWISNLISKVLRIDFSSSSFLCTNGICHIGQGKSVKLSFFAILYLPCSKFFVIAAAMALFT